MEVLVGFSIIKTYSVCVAVFIFHIFRFRVSTVYIVVIFRFSGPCLRLRENERGVIAQGCVNCPTPRLPIPYTRVKINTQPVATYVISYRNHRSYIAV